MPSLSSGVVLVRESSTSELAPPPWRRWATGAGVTAADDADDDEADAYEADDDETDDEEEDEDDADSVARARFPFGISAANASDICARWCCAACTSSPARSYRFHASSRCTRS